MPRKPQKLPTIRRGSSIRDSRCASSWSNQSFIQDEERRVQEECVEMLMVKLANKEKEVEMLRCKQDVVDAQSAGRDRQLSHQQEEHARVVDRMTLTNQELQREVQLLQNQCGQLQSSCEAQHTAALEQKRQREKDLAQANLNNAAHHRIVEELRRERQQSVNDQFALENKLQGIMQEQEIQHGLLQSKCLRLEDELQRSISSCQQLREALAHEHQKGMEAEIMAKKCDKEKSALDDKQRTLMKTLKAATSKAADMDKKHKEHFQVEDQLTKQLVALQKENLELKARRGQMSSQTKYLQARVATFEKTNSIQEQKLENAEVELENARKSNRDSHFRIKQLLEEITFLKNRKLSVLSSANDQARSDNQIAVLETDATDDVPCWMK